MLVRPTGARSRSLACKALAVVTDNNPRSYKYVSLRLTREIVQQHEAAQPRVRWKPQIGAKFTIVIDCVRAETTIEAPPWTGMDIGLAVGDKVVATSHEEELAGDFTTNQLG